MVIELARRVEALEARPAHVVTAADTGTTADVAIAIAKDRAYRETCRILREALQDAPKDMILTSDYLAEMVAKRMDDLRAQLATARQEGAEAERKRIAAMCEDNVGIWRRQQDGSGLATERAIAAVYAACWQFLRNSVAAKEGGAS
jgi:hypothetical protein